MTRTQALKDLKFYGSVTYRGVRITQLKQRVNNWDEYVNAWWVIPEAHVAQDHLSGYALGQRVTSRTAAVRRAETVAHSCVE
jgi:hypothetical protein